MNQDNGWPMGLEGVDIRVKILEAMRGVDRNPYHLSSPSFSSISFSDLDTESNASFFPERSMTLGNLMGITPLNREPRFGNTCGVGFQSEMGTNPHHRSNLKGRSWRLLMLCMHKDDEHKDEQHHNFHHQHDTVRHANGPTLSDLLHITH